MWRSSFLKALPLWETFRKEKGHIPEGFQRWLKGGAAWIVLIILGFWSLVFWERKLEEIEIYQNQVRKDLVIWKEYEQEAKKNSEIFTLFQKFEKVSSWSRTRLKGVIQALVAQYDLKLKDCQIREDKEGLRFYHLQFIVGAAHEGALMPFIAHLSGLLKPWVRWKALTIQRSGHGDHVSLEKREMITFVEAKIDVEWLGALD